MFAFPRPDGEDCHIENQPAENDEQDEPEMDGVAVFNKCTGKNREGNNRKKHDVRSMGYVQPVAKERKKESCGK